jgi:hypothetical protein
MTGLRVALVRLLVRVAIALALAVVVGLLLALVRSEADFRRDFGIACLLVGCVVLLMAPAGHSPAMRGGTIDTWTASFFPKLLPGMSEQYSGTTLSTSAVLGLTAVLLLVLGLLLVS